MDEATTRYVIQQLVEFGRELDEVNETVHSVSMRLAAIEAGAAGLGARQSERAATLAQINFRLDRIDQRLWSRVGELLPSRDVSGFRPPPG